MMATWSRQDGTLCSNAQDCSTVQCSTFGSGKCRARYRQQGIAQVPWWLPDAKQLNFVPCITDDETCDLASTFSACTRHLEVPRFFASHHCIYLNAHTLGCLFRTLPYNLPSHSTAFSPSASLLHLNSQPLPIVEGPLYGTLDIWTTFI